MTVDSTATPFDRRRTGRGAGGPTFLLVVDAALRVVHADARSRAGLRAAFGWVPTAGTSVLDGFASGSLARRCAEHTWRAALAGRAFEVAREFSPAGRTLVAQFSPVHDADGAVVGARCLARDVAGGVDPWATGTTLGAAIARLHDIVLVTEAEPVDGPDGPRIVFVNDAFERRTGYARDEVIGRTPRLLQGPATSRAALDRVRAALERWQPVRVELVNYTKAGAPFWLELDVAPVADASGWYTHWVAIERDITERKAVEAERERLLAEAESARATAEAERARATEANRAKSEFLTRMSHELRTPLNAIQGHVQLVELGIHGPVTDAQRDALGRATRAQRHLLGLINNLLSFAKLETGKVDYDVRETDLGEVLADVGPMIEPQFAARRLVYAVDVPPDPPTVWADAEKLRQVLLNLLSNAAKFTPPEGHVRVSCVVRPGMPEVVYVRVADTGPGIPRVQQDAVFDPFVQVRAAGAMRAARPLTAGHEGTGLGLAISRDLARGMGGDLRVRSEEGRGAAFTVTLRRVVGAAAPADGS